MALALYHFVILSFIKGSANHAEQKYQSRDPDEKGRLFGAELAAARNVLFNGLVSTTIVGTRFLGKGS